MWGRADPRDGGGEAGADEAVRRTGVALDGDAPWALFGPEAPGPGPHPNNRGLNLGLFRSHAWNVGMAISVARLACQAAAKASIES